MTPNRAVRRQLERRAEKIMEQKAEKLAKKYKKMTEAEFKEWLMSELIKAYKEARKNKRSTMDTHAFEMNLAENLLRLRDDIMSRHYRPSRGIAFIVEKPVKREVFAAPFRDRVVHHFLYNMCYDWWDRRLIRDSYSCRVGKGTGDGVRRLAQNIRRASKNYTQEVIIYKGDLQGYFMSLDRRRLFDKVCWGLERQFKGHEYNVYRVLRFLWAKIIFDNPVKGVKIRGGKYKWRGLPANKSLFCQPKGRGIVIGNLSSQLLSNIFLDAFDRYITMDLGYKYYGRYVDDFYIIVPREKKDKLMMDLRLIRNYLMGMGLMLHPKKQYIQPMEKGVMFLGARIYPYVILPGKRLLNNFREATRKRAMDLCDDTTIISYLGLVKHFKHKKIVREIFEEVGWEFRY